MKKLLTLLLMHFVINASAQVSPITMLPQHGSGYLILNKFAYPDIVSWTVQIAEGNGEGDVYKYNPVQETELLGLNYLRIDEKFWNLQLGDYFVQVTGKDSNKEIVISTGYINIGTGPLYTKECEFKCVSKWYAYRIDLLVSLNGGNHILQLNSAFNENAGIGIPYYRYESFSNWTSFCGGPNPPNAWFGCVLDGVNQSSVTLTAADNIHDNSGSLLTGAAVRIKKTMGLWDSQSWVTSPLTGGQSECQFPISYHINDLNNYNIVATNAPDLECLNDVEVFDVPDMEDVISTCEEAAAVFPGPSNIGFFDLTELLVNCPEFQQQYPDELDPICGIWPGILDNITIYPMDKEGPVQTISASELVGSNGECTIPTITLGPGLYCAGLTFTDKSYLPLIKEVEKELVSSVALSEFVDVTAFPNPFTGDEYEVNISADAKVKFSYLVTDFNGNIVYEKNFVVQQGHSVNHTIKLKGNIPNGSYYNSLQFEDGSIKSFTVIKQ